MNGEKNLSRAITLFNSKKSRSCMSSFNELSERIFL